MTYRLNKLLLVNFCLCVVLQFAWLGYACARGQSVHDHFLIYSSSRGTPAWVCILIAPALLAGYFVERPDLNRFARLAAGVLGIGGLVWALGVPYLLSTIYEEHSFIFRAETAFGAYVLLSQVALAVYWKPRPTNGLSP